MSNIVGEPFNEIIKTQIETRQEYFGDLSSSVKEIRKNQIQLLHNSNAFIKLASSVNVSEDALKNIGVSESLSENKLAEKFVLFNGVSDFSNENPIQKSGLNRDKNSTGIGNNLYGLGGLDFGQVPMPGITNVSIIHKNRGSLREATISLKAHNYKQFNIIDILYLRLGYTVLLEIGHHHYIDNDKKLKTNDHSLIRKFLKDSYDNYYDLLDDISTKTLETNGNYDAMLGKITNFNWSFSPDGSYDITITLTSIGDVIESLVINKTNPYNNESLSELSELTIRKIAKESLDLVDLGRGGGRYYNNKGFVGFTYKKFQLKIDGEIVKRGEVKPHINNFPKLNEIIGGSFNGDRSEESEFEIKFKFTEGNIDKPFKEDNPEYKEFKKELEGLAVRIIQQRLKDIKPKNRSEFLNKIDNKINAYNSELGYKLLALEQTIIDNTQNISGQLVKYPSSSSPGFKISFSNNDFGVKYYTKFYKLCDLIQNTIYQYNKGNDNVSCLKFNLNKNFYYKNPYTLSSDPTKLFVINNHKISKIFTNSFPSLNSLTDFFSNLNNEILAGNIGDIYLSIDYILDKIENNINEDGDITLFKLLKSTCDDINLYLGGVNKIEPVIDETKNEVYFIDQTTPLNQPPPLPESIAEFKIYSILPGEGSFVKDFGITSKITNKLATQISIGAQATNSPVLENATSFQSWNKGITDRIAPNKTDIIERDKDKLKETLKIINLKKQYREILGRYIINLTKEDINKFISINKEIQRLFSKKLAEETKLPSPGTESFIPISLNLKMHGLSGIKIYQSFDVQTNFLPLNYRDKLKFLITKINHSIQNNSWVTDLETLVTPKITQSEFENQEEIAKNLDIFEFEFELKAISFDSGLNRARQDQDNTQININVVDPSLIIPFFYNPLYFGKTLNGKLSPLDLRGYDGFGSGAFGASRRGGKHEGIDLITTPINPNEFKEGEKINYIPIVAPIDGVVELVSAVYGNNSEENRFYNKFLRGFKIQGRGQYDQFSIKMFYVILNNDFFTNPPRYDENKGWENVINANFRKGKIVKAGDIVGYAQFMSPLYEKFSPNKTMTNHIHYQLHQGNTYGNILNPTENIKYTSSGNPEDLLNSI
jgi:hypothetical protein